MSESEISSEDEEEEIEDEGETSSEEQEYREQPAATQPLIESEAEEGEQEGSTLKKRKRKSADVKSSKGKTIKKSKTDASSSSAPTADSTPPAQKDGPLLKEKKHEKKDVEKKASKPGKKEQKMFNDRNIDIDLFDSDPEKIVSKKIRLNSSLLLSCKTMEATSASGGQIEWAAILFEKKMKDGRSFDYNMSLGLAPHIIEGLKEIMKANPKYFKTANVS